MVPNDRPMLCANCYEPEDVHVSGKCLYGPSTWTWLKGCDKCHRWDGMADVPLGRGWTSRWGFYCNCQLGRITKQYIAEKRPGFC